MSMENKTKKDPKQNKQKNRNNQITQKITLNVYYTMLL